MGYFTVSDLEGFAVFAIEASDYLLHIEMKRNQLRKDSDEAPH